MSIASFYLRNMLHQYDRQVVTARIAQYRRRSWQQATGEEPTLSPEARRQILVERVARELFENLLFTGSDTPMVKEVQKTLQEEFDDSLVFQYPPNSLEMMILQKTPNGTEEVSPQFRADILDRAWEITLAKVDETML